MAAHSKEGLAGGRGKASPALVLATLLIVPVVSGCLAPLVIPDPVQHAPEARILLMPVDIGFWETTAGGLSKIRADWTETAGENLWNALEAFFAERGTRVAPYERPEEPQQESLHTQIRMLFVVVAQTIAGHKYVPLNDLPTMNGRFDWSLGDETRNLKTESSDEFALFIVVRENAPSPNRALVSVLREREEKRERWAVASLVDLSSGRLIWFNRVAIERSPMDTWLDTTLPRFGMGDLLDPAAAHRYVQLLLRELPL